MTKQNFSFHGMRTLVVLSGLASVGILSLCLVFRHRSIVESPPSSHPGAASDDVEKPLLDHSSRIQQQLVAGIQDGQRRGQELQALETEYARRQRDEEARRRADEAAYWETREDWIERFPFEPSYHLSIVFDPDQIEFQGGTPESLQMQRMLERHRFLSSFYHESPQRFSFGFEQMHDILSEAALEPDPVIWGRIFSHLVEYHEAGVHPSGDPFPIPQAGKTWGEVQENTWRSLLGWLTWDTNIDGSHEILLSESDATILAERLIAEIPEDHFVGQSPIVSDHKYDAMLKRGDPILID